MAKILIVGGGFGGVVAAESLAKKLGNEHQITLVSRSRKFLFYPALVRLAFGRGEPDDVSFDIRKARFDRRVQFVEGEVARIHLSKNDKWREACERQLHHSNRALPDWRCTDLNLRLFGGRDGLQTRRCSGSATRLRDKRLKSAGNGSDTILSGWLLVRTSNQGIHSWSPLVANCLSIPEAIRRARGRCQKGLSFRDTQSS